MNLFLTEDGLLKLGYYGLTTQEECCSIMKTDCEGIRGYGFEEENEASDVWHLGTVLVSTIGIIPRVLQARDWLNPGGGRYALDFDKSASVPKELVDFLQRCIQKKNERWSVSELMDVSGME